MKYSLITSSHLLKMSPVGVLNNNSGNVFRDVMDEFLRFLEGLDMDTLIIQLVDYSKLVECVKYFL